MTWRSIATLLFQSLTLGAGMALALAISFDSPRLFWLSLPCLTALVFYAIKPWPGDL